MPVQPEHEKDAAEHQHGGADHAPDKIGYIILNLGNVVGYSGYQRAGADPVHLGEGEGHDIAKGILSHFISDILPGHVDEYIVQTTAKTPKEDKSDHLNAQCPNQVKIPDTPRIDTQHALIHNAAHDLRLQQIHQHLADHERRGNDGKMEVFLYIVPHDVSSPSWRYLR